MTERIWAVPFGTMEHNEGNYRALVKESGLHPNRALVLCYVA